MKLRLIGGAMLALLVVPLGAARPQEPDAPASFAAASLVSASLARPLVQLAPVECVVPVTSAPSQSAPRLDAVGYRPRHRGYSGGGYARSAPAQVHAGFFELEGNGPTSFAIGLRGGPAIDDHVQLGVGVDWYRKTESRREVVGETFQGGQSIIATRVLARASSNLLPFQAFLQVSGGNSTIIPYAGVAGQYQVLLLSATDYQTGADFDATFGGWGWQLWGGAALPLSGQSRVFGEAFMNSGDVERDVDDPASGLTYREIVDSDGVGMRFGVSWGF